MSQVTAADSPPGPPPPSVRPVSPPTAPTRWHEAAKQSGLGVTELVMRFLGAKLRRSDPRFAHLRRALHEGDPLADAVADLLHDTPSARALLEVAIERGEGAVPDAPAPIRALVHAVDRDPPWLDREALRVATETMLRMGTSGSYALAGASLMSGYLSSGGVKPLVATGALTRLARRRIAETNKFIRDIMTSGDCARFSDGVKTTLRVRVMHAVIRRRLAGAPTWQTGAWGAPINQHDMAGTNLQFSVVYLAGLTGLGFVVTRREREAVMHLWRYFGWLIGVREELLPATLAEGLELLWALLLTEEAPDTDSRDLATALIEALADGLPSRVGQRMGALEGRFLAGYSRYILGRAAADALGLPDDPWKYAPLVVAPVRVAAEALQRMVPGGRAWAVKRGRRQIELEAAVSLGGEPATFRA